MKKHLLRSRQGFTIVELLIVVVVIAILAAITIVSYNGIQRQANIAATKTELSTLNKKLLISYENNNMLPASAPGSAGLDALQADLGGISTKSTWSTTSPDNASTQTPKTKFFIRSSNNDTDGSFSVYFWDYEAGAWMQAYRSWFAQEGLGEVSISSGQLRQPDESGNLCTTEFIEQCVRVSE